MPLTDTAIRNAKASTKAVKLFDGGGLFLLIQPRGTKLWRLAYRFGGKQKVLAFGVYPMVFKALAVDYQHGQAAVSQEQFTLSTAIDEATARCSEGGATCELYAVGDVMVHGLAKEQADAAIEQYRGRIVAGRIAKLEKAYLENRIYDDFKALAVDYQSGRSAVSQAQPTPSKAIERAIAACSTQTIVCEIHSVGNIIVHGKTKEDRDSIVRNYSWQAIEHVSADNLREYLSKNEFKSFVIDVPGHYWTYQAGHWHPLVAFNFALKRCRERGHACEVVFLGDTFVFDRSEASIAATIDEYNRTVIGPADARNPLREYMNEARFSDFKAFAASPNMRNWQRESGFPSPSKAIEETIALCRTRNASCELYAIGSHVVFGQSDEEKNATVAAYAREVLEKRLEFFRQPSYGNFKAIAGNPDTIEYSVAIGSPSAREAVQEVMRTCSERHGSCQTFAIGDAVVFGFPQERIDQAVEQYQRDVDASRQMSH